MNLFQTISFSLTLWLISHTQNKQSKFVEIPLIEKIDTNFHLIIDNHIEVLEERGIHSEEFILIQIYPQVSRAQGIPKNVIDSLYKENMFPPGYISAGYTFAVTTFNRPEFRFCNFIGVDDRQFLYFYKGKMIFIDSVLNLSFETTVKKKVTLCGDGELTDFSSKEYMTFYHYTSNLNLVEVRDCGKTLIPN